MVRRVFEDSSVSTELKHEGTAGSTLLAEDQLQLPLLGTIGLRSDVVVVTKVQLVYTYSIWVSFRISLKQHSCLWSKADENNPLNKEEKQRIWANVSKTFQNLTLISLFNLHVLSSNDVWKCSSLENTIRVKHGDDSPLWWNLLRKQVPKSILMTPLCCADLQKMHLLQLMTASQKPLLIQTLDSASDSLEVDRWRRPWNKLPKNPSPSPEDTETGSSVKASYRETWWTVRRRNKWSPQWTGCSSGGFWVTLVDTSKEKCEEMKTSRSTVNKLWMMNDAHCVFLW